MQTPRILTAIAAIALCAIPFLTRADDTPAQAAARAALMQDMNDTGNTDTATPPPATPPPAAPPQTPPPVSVPPPPPVTTDTNWPAATPTMTPVATPPPVATMPTEAQGSSTNLVVPPVEQEVPPTTQATQYPVNPAPANSQPNAMMTLTNAPSETPGTMPGSVSEPAMTAPSLPISEGQQQQLQALLQQYEANQITSAQYQAQRAKILAGQ